MLEAGEEPPTSVKNLDQLEKVPRASHRLIDHTGKKWTKDELYVHYQRELKSDDDAMNDFLKELKLKVVTFDEAYPGARQAEEEALRLDQERIKKGNLNSSK